MPSPVISGTISSMNWAPVVEISCSSRSRIEIKKLIQNSWNLVGCNNSCLNWKHSLDIKWCLYYSAGNCGFLFLHLDLQPFLFPLAPQRLCLRNCGTFLNTSCSLSFHNWNSAFKFKWLITHSDSHWKVCNRYQCLHGWQQCWEETLHSVERKPWVRYCVGGNVYLRKFGSQRQEEGK